MAGPEAGLDRPWYQVRAWAGGRQVKGPIDWRWSEIDDADILLFLAQGKTHKGIARYFPKRSLYAVQRRIKVLTAGKRPCRPKGVPVNLSMRLPVAMHDQWKIEAELLGMTFARYIREKLVGGR